MFVSHKLRGPIFYDARNMQQGRGTEVRIGNGSSDERTEEGFKTNSVGLRFSISMDRSLSLPNQA